MVRLGKPISIYVSIYVSMYQTQKQSSCYRALSKVTRDIALSSPI